VAVGELFLPPVFRSSAAETIEFGRRFPSPQREPQSIARPTSAVPLRKGRGRRYPTLRDDKPRWPCAGIALRKEPPMLVLSRHRDESIMIGDDIVVTIVDIRGDKVRLGIQAPSDIPVHRQEVYEAIQRENRKANELRPTDARDLGNPNS
jgi:carbon storage regulator